MTSTIAVSVPATADASTSPPQSQHRGDIQGLRAVAVLLVLAYHAGIPGIRGGFVGVDVFFVISGFLITGLIVREIERTGRLQFGRFYARRIRRLLPATAVVLLFTAALTALALPITRWESILRDIGAAALYVVNWRLAATSVDYLAAEQAASPVQHFWSLAVEEQFYLVWPLVVLGCLLLHRRFGWTLRRCLGVGLAAIAIPSLIWSAYYTTAAPGPAYFVSTTRLWELAAGASLVLLAERTARIPLPLAKLLGWAGLAGILAAALLYTTATPFPGVAALLPVLSTVAVLAAGTATDGGGAAWFLRWHPMRQIGDMSYSLYLWHWPLVIVGTAVFARSDGSVEWGIGLLLVCTAAVPAWFTYVAVERPVHTSPAFLRRPAVLATLAVCTLLPVLAAVALQTSLDRRAESALTPADGALGAAVLGNDPTSSAAGDPPQTLGATVPDITVAGQDNAIVYEEECHQFGQRSEAVPCRSGLLTSDTRVALVGDSHAVQWQPTLQALADERGWALDSYSKSACGMVDVEIASGDPLQVSPSCRAWNSQLVGALLAGDYDLVLTTGDNGYAVLEDDQLVEGAAARTALRDSYLRTWTRLDEAGVEVTAIANTPRMSVDVPDCLASHPDDVPACATDRQQALTAAGDTQLAASELSAGRVPLIDLGAWICPQERCSPVIGGVIVFRDEHHLTATYARSLAPQLARQLDEVDLLR